MNKLMDEPVHCPACGKEMIECSEHVETTEI